MSKLVTIGIPMYKRFEYLPRVLEIVASQDYPNIDLLVSDNGMNGSVVREMVDKLYPKPYRFRQNPSTVGISEHFSQLVREARGEYFVPLADDDEISPNYVSDLAALLDKHPQASVAFGVQESFNDLNHVIGKAAIGDHNKAAGLAFGHCFEGAVYLITVAGVKRLDRAAYRSRGGPQLCNRGIGNRVIGIDQHGHQPGAR